MSEAELLREVLGQISASVERILVRFKPVSSVSFFLDSEAGLEKLDAICMQLIAIGESLKNLDKISGGTFLTRYPEIDWKAVKGMRDIITHHYFDLDAEAVFSVCEDDLPQMKVVLEAMLCDIDGGLEVPK